MVRLLELKTNPYTYAENDPVNEIDPGEKAPSFIACTFIAGAAFLGALGITGGGTNLASALTTTVKVVPGLIEALAKIGINIAEKFVPVIGWIMLAFGLFSAGVVLYAAGCI